VFAMNAVMREVVQQEEGPAKIGLNDVRVFDFEFFEELDPGRSILVFSDLGENLELIQGRLRMRLFASLDFHCCVLIGELIMDEPDSGEMSPAEFLDNNVFLVEPFAEHYRMVAFRTVIGVVLTLRIVLVLIIFLLDHCPAIYYKLTTKPIIDFPALFGFNFNFIILI
jgi:hypothetical protein